MTLFGLRFRTFRHLTGWYTSVDPALGRAQQGSSDTWSHLSLLAKKLSSEANEQDYQVFCGLFDSLQRNHRLFAISGIHPCQLVLDFRVGSHNRGWPDAEEASIKEVYEQMRQIYEVRTFRPYFVDAAGYHCVFEGQITKAEAMKVEKLFHAGGEWYAQSMVDDYDIVPVIVRENELHLWWD